MKLVAVLRNAHATHGVNAFITPSRRTGEQAKSLLVETLAQEHWVTIWDGTGENPYFGILALSQRLIVTGESISMISEALASGAPVHVLRLEGHGQRHEAFLSRVIGDGLVSEIRGDDLDWSFAGKGPVNATGVPAARLRKLLGLDTV